METQSAGPSASRTKLVAPDIHEEGLPPLPVVATTVIRGLRIDSLTTVVRTVKILAIHMSCFDQDMVINLMRCFPCLEKLYAKEKSESWETDSWNWRDWNPVTSLDIRLRTIVVRCLEKLYMKSIREKNLWHRKHLSYLRSYEIRLKTIVMGYYRGIRAQVNFASFFVLNARMLESIRLEVTPDNYNEAFFAEQHRMLQMEKRAFSGARLYFTSVCHHSVQDIDEISDFDLTDPFACGC